MRLEMETIRIDDLRFGDRTTVIDHILHIDPQELETLLLQDKRIKSVSLDLVSENETVRIVNIVDVVQPRCKIEAADNDFPGWLGKMKIAGKGKTRSLEGLSVVLSNKHSKRSYASILDMFGMGSRISKYAKMKNLCLAPDPVENLDEKSFETAVKIAGLKTAVYLARAAEGQPADRTQVYELDISRTQGEASNLPRVAYYFQLYTPQHDYKGIPDPVLYATEVSNQLPFQIHPNEILDGAMVSMHTLRCMETYSLQNHAVINELYRRNGKELVFCGCVCGVATIDPVQRDRMAVMASNLIHHALRPDGVILTKAYGGMPHADLGITAEKCEALGMKTTLFVTPGQLKGSLSEEMLFGSDCLNAIVNVGNIAEKIKLSKPDRIVGGNEMTPVFDAEMTTQTAGDEKVQVEEFLIAGSYDMLGSSHIVGIEY